MTEKSMITPQEWEHFFDTLIKLAPNEYALIKLSGPIVDTAKSAGYGPVLMRFLDDASDPILPF